MKSNKATYRVMNKSVGFEGALLGMKSGLTMNRGKWYRQGVRGVRIFVSKGIGDAGSIVRTDDGIIWDDVIMKDEDILANDWFVVKNICK